MNKYKDFLIEFVEAWEDGMGGESYIYIKAKELLKEKPKQISIEQFNTIPDLRIYLLNHPDQEMVRTSVLHYLGDETQKILG
jgi:hypothetical protein